MERLLKILNQLEEKKVFTRYALGGAFALLFYSEPKPTYDVDVFIFLPKQTGGLIDLTPLSEHLKKMGYKWNGEHIMIEGFPVQFIPAPDPLTEEALEEATVKDYEKVKVKVLRLEYLMAIMLQTNRPKDREMIAKLFEEKIEMDHDKFSQILSRHKPLQERWKKIVAKEK